MIKTLRQMAASAAFASALFVAPAVMAQTPAAPAVAAVPQAEGQGPAMWVIRDEDSTIYLYGSFHLLKPTTQWGQAHVDAAFAASDEIWFELTDMNDQSQMLSLLQNLGMSPERPLSSILSAEDIAQLDAIARTMGASAAAFDPMRPWMVSMQLAIVQLMSGGFDPNLGVEKVLMARAQEMGKPMKGFETMAEQFGILAGVSEEGQIEMLRSTLRDLHKGPEQIEEMANAWATGNVETIETLMIDEMKVNQPEAYEAMLTRRNINWANQIKGILAGSGTSFIAVGAGHLAGEDSVQTLLAADGIVAERVLN